MRKQRSGKFFIKNVGVVFVISLIINISIGNYDVDSLLHYARTLGLYGYTLLKPMMGS